MFSADLTTCYTTEAVLWAELEEVSRNKAVIANALKLFAM